MCARRLPPTTTYGTYDRYMRNKKLPLHLRDHVWNFYQMQFKGGKLFDEQAILKDLTPSLRQRVLEWAAKDVLAKVPIIISAPRGFSSSAAASIVPQFVFRNDMVFREGSIAAKMCV